MQKKKASSVILWNDQTLNMVCADPSVLLVGVRDELGLCIVSAFATSPFGSEYLFNINLREGRQFTAAVIFWCIQRLENTQIQWLNLGGGLRQNDSLAKAKERYGPVYWETFSVYDSKCFGNS